MNNPVQPQFQANASPNMVLAIVSMALAVIGFFGMIPTLVVVFCGIFPMGFGLGAIIFGALAALRAHREPAKYGGKALAMIGIAIGAVCLVLPAIYIGAVMVIMFA